MCLSQGTCHELLNLNLISMLVGCLFSNSQPIASALLLWVHIQHYKKLGVGTPWYLSDSLLTMEYHEQVISVVFRIQHQNA